MDKLRNVQEFPNGDEDLENTDEFSFKVGQIFSLQKIRCYLHRKVEIPLDVILPKLCVIQLTALPFE